MFNAKRAMAEALNIVDPQPPFLKPPKVIVETLFFYRALNFFITIISN